MPTDSELGGLDAEQKMQREQIKELMASLAVQSSQQRATSERLGALGVRVHAVEAALHENTRTTNESLVVLQKLADDVQGWWAAGEKGLRVLGWLGSAAKWCGGLAVGAWGVYETYRKWKG